MHTGPPGSTQANQQAAVVQDLARRHKVSCPAHPAHRGPWQGQFSSQAQQASLQPSQAASSVAAPSVAAARLEYTFASPAFDPASDADQVWSVEHSLSMDSTVRAFSESAGLWANFCVKHDTTHECLHHSPGQHYRTNCSSSNDSASERQSQLQAAFADINMRKAILKDPMLLSYCPNTLAGHIHHLQLLVGKPEASAMIAKMPTLLHYKAATLSTKLDEMYDLLPKADVSKVCHSIHNACMNPVLSCTAASIHSVASMHVSCLAYIGACKDLLHVWFVCRDHSCTKRSCSSICIMS